MENKQREVKCIVQGKRTEVGFKPSDSGVHILKLQYLKVFGFRAHGDTRELFLKKSKEKQSPEKFHDSIIYLL